MGSLVVFPSLLGVGEDFVDLLNLLEALLGAGVIRVSIRVVLSDQPPVSLPDLVPGGTPGYPEQLVKILTRHPTATILLYRCKASAPYGTSSARDHYPSGSPHS